jgi:predicted small secreted protein
MKTLISLLAFTALAMALSGCNTIQGLGQDIKKGGEIIEGAAKK